MVCLFSCLFIYLFIFWFEKKVLKVLWFFMNKLYLQCGCLISRMNDIKRNSVDENKKKKKKKKTKFPVEVKMEIQRFIVQQFPRYQHINSICKQEELNFRQVEVWCEDVIKLCRRNNKQNMDWIHRIPGGRLNRLYKIVYRGKVPKNIELFLIVEEVRGMIKSVYEGDDDSIYASLDILSGQKKFFYQVGTFDDTRRKVYILLQSQKLVEFKETMEGNQKYIKISFENEALQKQYNTKIFLHRGINWNTITVSFNK